MYKIVILPPATSDIKDAAHWYESKKEGLGKRFVRFVRKKVTTIAGDPNLYAIRYSDVRTAIIDVFPFMIHFKMEEEAKMIIIIAVLHTSQNPDNWSKREQ